MAPHKKANPEDAVKCPKCGKTYKNDNGLRVHDLVAHQGRTWDRTGKKKLTSLQQLPTPTPGERIREIADRTRAPQFKEGSNGHRKKRRTRIEWNDDERKTLYDNALHRWKQNPENGIGYLLFDAAQSAISIDRRRNIASNQNCGGMVERLIAEAKGITTTALEALKPQIEYREKIVEKVATPEEVLANISTARLIGIVESRRYAEEQSHREEMAYIAATGKRPERQKRLRDIETSEVMADLGMTDPTQVRLRYPKVCLVGFEKTREDFLRDKLARHAINIFHVIHSKEVPNETAIPIAIADVILVDKDNTPDEWKKLIIRLMDQKKIRPEVYQHAYGLEKCRNLLTEIALDWTKKNPTLAALHAKLIGSS